MSRHTLGSLAIGALSPVFVSMLAMQPVDAWGGDSHVEGDSHAEVWNLARDVDTTGNQIGFSQGAAGVWYFMASHSLAHNPQLYTFIRDYNAPSIQGDSPPKPPIVIPDGFSCWQSLESFGKTPAVCFNFTDSLLTIDTLSVPPHTLEVHPGTDRLVIVAWKSPVDGHGGGGYSRSSNIRTVLALL